MTIPYTPAFPLSRPRRTRQNPAIRSMVSENHLSPKDLIWPIFIQEGEQKTNPVPSMPGVNRLSIDLAIEAVKEILSLGVSTIALFPVTPKELLDETGSESLNPDNLICRATKALKAACPEITLIGDVALDPYTSHGHDGIIKNGKIENDGTVEILVKQALNQAKAGVDIIAPSDMMDGRIGAIRKALDEAGLELTCIMSYAAKYASAFYGPFRQAVGAGDRLCSGKETYQMDSANSDEALREVAFDLQEGADMIMVKPGMPYLDIIRRVRDNFTAPLFAYQVSGEFAMLNAAFDNGWLDREKSILESLLAFKRAGCNGILTYFAPEAARLLQK
ncbi:porphobilinogen synthase [Acetobacteraceae bacterium]|nr:porphobilinogen synthase [Acetobacteraceae bacterium]